MNMKITSTREAAKLNGIKILVYGPPDAGKTYLCSTIPNPLIISAESGLLTLADYDIATIEVNSLQELREAYAFIASSEEAKQYDTICLDSISDIAERVLSFEKKANKDKRMAYMMLGEQMSDLIRAFRALPKNVYFSAKLERSKDDYTGMMLYRPSMPGNALTEQLPHYFDFVLALRKDRDNDGNIYRYLQCEGDLQYIAKNRGGYLPRTMEPDLSRIYEAISHGKR